MEEDVVSHIKTPSVYVSCHIMLFAVVMLGLEPVVSMRSGFVCFLQMWMQQGSQAAS